MGMQNARSEHVSYSKSNKNDEINLLEAYEKYKFHWKWFVISVFVSLLIAVLFLALVQREYEVSSTVFIDDKESGGISSEATFFEDLSLSEKPSITNEIEVLKSRTLIENVIMSLDLSIFYFDPGIIRNKEIYGDQVPFTLKVQGKNSRFFELDTSLVIMVAPGNKFKIENEKGNVFGPFDYEESIATNFGNLYLIRNPERSYEPNAEFIVKIKPVKEVSYNYRKRIDIVSLGKKSSLVSLTLQDKVKQKAMDILDNLLIQYNQNAIEYKALVTKNTDKFINDRIEDISLELTNVDKGVEDFKVQNQLSDMDTESMIDLTSNSEIEKDIVDLTSQIRLIEFVIEYMNDNPGELIPDNIKLNDDNSNDNIGKYNNLLLERNRIIKNSSKINPAVINLESQISTLEEVIKQSLKNLKSSLNYSLNDARSKEHQINTRKELAPKQERLFQDIKRKQQIIESLYLYLLEKREENAITLGIPVPNGKIIDKADGATEPVFPKPLIILGGAFLVGMFIPFFVISIRSLFDNTVHSVEEVSNSIQAPIIGEIPKEKNNKIILKDQGNSSYHEAFRLLRTNLSFMIPADKEGSKTLFVTSTIGSEGKTSVSINLATILAAANKKVLLIEADLRKPQLNNYLNLEAKKGLTHFLAGMDNDPTHLLVQVKELGIDIIVAGEIPPNPSELILNSRFEKVLDHFGEEYDYIIIDTPPVKIVTDTLILSKYADMFVYVVRSNYLDKRLLSIPQKLYGSNRLPNLGIVFNDSDFKKSGIKGSYGYYE